MELSPTEQANPKRVRKLKVIEVKPRRRYFWAGPVIAVFLALMFRRNKVISHAILILLLISAFPLIVHVSSENVSATSADNTWIADGSSSASVAASWENDTLVSGQNIWFTSAHVGACSWNVADSFGTFNIKTYTNTVTQAASFSVTGYSQAAGTYTGSTSFVLSDSGGFLQSGGTITNNVLRAIFSGEGSTVSLIGEYYNTVRFFGIQISANVTLSSNGAMMSYGPPYVTIDAGKTLTLTLEKQFLYFPTTNSVFTNNGVIAGLGTLTVWVYDADRIMTFGVVNAPLQIRDDGSSTSNRIITLGSDTALGSTFSISSAHATHTATLDLSASNYTLSTTAITIGTRGVLKGRASQITASGNFDSSAGSYLPESSSLHLTGASKILKTNGVAGFQNLFLDSSGSYTLSSNVTTYKYWGNGTLTKGSYNLYVNNDQAPAFTSGAMGTEISWLDDYSYDANATDQENETLTYGLDTDMPDLTVNTSTGVVSSSQPQANGTFYVHVSVTDGNHTVWLNASVTVTNLAPGITSRPRMSVVQYESYFYLVVASDPEGATLTVNISTNAPWLTVNPNGSISGSPLHRDVGTWLINVSVWDGYRTTYDNYSIEVSTLDSATMMLVMTTLAFALGALLLIVGFKDNTFWILAGPVWVISGLLIFIDYGVVFLLVSVGLGIVLMFKGVSPYL
jgi:hypothetical protein